MKMTVTRALAELKQLSSRISKATSMYYPFEVATGEKLRGTRSHKKLEDFQKEIKEEAQSLKDLIRRQEAIKDAISQSNAITKVKVGKDEFTIVQILNRKQTTLEAYAKLKTTLEDRIMRAKREFDSQVADRESAIERMVKTRLETAEKGGRSVKEEEKLNFRELEEKQTPEVNLLDPSKAEEWLKEITEYVENFTHEVDYLLSESNSTTEIDIPD